jgi:hypothetical protein
VRFAWVYLEDQAPPIGCGWRSLFIEEGPKWVYLLDWAKLLTVRLTRGEWESVRQIVAGGRSPTGAAVRRTGIRATLLQRLGEAGREPTAREERALAATANAAAWKVACEAEAEGAE